MKRRYNFDKTTEAGQLASGGIAVHADSMEEAERLATEMLRPGERLLGFRDNMPCQSHCDICHANYLHWKDEATTLANGLLWMLGDDDICLEAMHKDGMTPKEAIQALYEDAGCPINDEPQTRRD